MLIRLSLAPWPGSRRPRGARATPPKPGSRSGGAGDGARCHLRPPFRGRSGGVLLARNGEVELRTQHRKSLEGAHPRQGAVLILWLARAAGAEVDAETILRHAVGIGQIAARRVGAAVIALDPYDEETERMWRERFGFRRSLTRRPDADRVERARLWMPLFPEG
jgi:hypothetical protein